MPGTRRVAEAQAGQATLSPPLGTGGYLMITKGI